MFYNKREVPGLSVKHKVDADDEWCAEAYVETDYDDLCDNYFIQNLRSYLSFLIADSTIMLLDAHNTIATVFSNQSNISLNSRDWRFFKYSDIFDLKKGKRVTKKDLLPGTTPYVTAIATNNGITDYINLSPDHDGNVISVNYDGSVGEAYYQRKPFFALDSVNVLYPKFRLNQYIATFLITLIKKEKFKFNYGRKWHLKRMRETKIFLPVDNDGNPDWLFMDEYIRSLCQKKS
jgi:hypothetical protein